MKFGWSILPKLFCVECGGEADVEVIENDTRFFFPLPAKKFNLCKKCFIKTYKEARFQEEINKRLQGGSMDR